MADDIRDPAQDLQEVDVDELDTGFDDDDLEEVINSVKGERFQYAGVQCRVRKAKVEGQSGIELSKQEFWFAGVKVDWPEDVMFRAQQMFESDIYTADELDGWVEVRVGHRRAVSREEVEDEAEWLAEQVVMLENDPNAPV